MEIPAPVDLSKIQGILGNARAVMKAVETKVPITSNHTKPINENLYDGLNYSEDDEREPAYKTPTLSDYRPTVLSQAPVYTVEQVMASNFPPIVKEAMLKTARQRETEAAYGVDELGRIKETPARKPAAPLRESAHQSNDMITISKAQLNEMIDERLVKFLTQSYNKKLTEEIIKRTINTLIKEGKINVKK